MAVAEDQAEGASGQEQARKGLGGMKLAPGAQQQQAGQVRAPPLRGHDEIVISCEIDHCTALRALFFGVL